jgi:hypothetical protein
VPTSSPSSAPSSVPTSSPSSTPTSMPTSSPSSAPSSVPTSSPSSAPSSVPTSSPSFAHSLTSSLSPSVASPSFNLSARPSVMPTFKPSVEIKSYSPVSSAVFPSQSSSCPQSVPQHTSVPSSKSPQQNHPGRKRASCYCPKKVSHMPSTPGTDRGPKHAISGHTGGDKPTYKPLFQSVTAPPSMRPATAPLLELLPVVSP